MLDMAARSVSETVSLQTILREGIRIGALFLFWGILAAISRYGIGNLGFARPGKFFFELGTHLALLFVLIGVASVLLYVIARGIQLSNQ